MKQAASAAQLGYSLCSIGREITRHRVAEVGYRAYWAQARADDAAKRKEDGASFTTVRGGAKPTQRHPPRQSYRG